MKAVNRRPRIYPRGYTQRGVRAIRIDRYAALIVLGHTQARAYALAMGDALRAENPGSVRMQGSRYGKQPPVLDRIAHWRRAGVKPVPCPHCWPFEVLAIYAKMLARLNMPQPDTSKPRTASATATTLQPGTACGVCRGLGSVP